MIAGATNQAVKAIVRSAIEPGGANELLPFLKLVNVRNTGVAFSMFSGGGTLLVVFAIIATIALLGFFFAHAERPLRCSFGQIWSGQWGRIDGR